MKNPTIDAPNAAHPDGAITVRDTPMQAGLRAVREMEDDLSVEDRLRTELQAAHDRIDALEGRKHDMPDAPDAAGDGARVEAIARVLDPWAFVDIEWSENPEQKAFLQHEARNTAGAIIAADPATSRIRALEEANRALLEAAKRYLKAGDAYLDERHIADDVDLMMEFGSAQEQLRSLVQS